MPASLELECRACIITGSSRTLEYDPVLTVWLVCHGEFVSTHVLKLAPAIATL